MKRILVTCLFMLLGGTAFAEVIVPYGEWTRLNYCGGETRLICDNVQRAREQNRCFIEFRNVQRCSWIKMYVDDDYYPDRNTYQSRLKREFYVDNRRIEHFLWDIVYGPWFNVYLSESKTSNRKYEKIQYQFDY